MNINKGLLKFAKALNLALETVEFENVETSTGEQINLSGREVGSEVTIADSAPAPDGEYVLSDGFKFTVKDGKIDSIIEEVQKVEEEVLAEEKPSDVVVEDAPKSDDKDKEIEALKAEIESLKEQIASLTSQFSAIENFATKEQFENLQTVFNSLNESVLKLANIPVEESKTSLGFKSNNKKYNDMAALANALKK
ncbi:hypothetical protein [Pedobacter steynii]